ASIEARVQRAKDDGRLRSQAEEELRNDNIAKAGAVYEDAIGNTRETNRKIELYLDLANLYYNAGKVPEALEAGEKAEAVSGDKFLAADWLGRAYEGQKDYIKAATYYRVAGESVASSQNVYQFDKEHYDKAVARVTELQAAQ
ncbi:MAG: hypothetical protein WAS27_02700, partial [Candidatus Saccharimonadales bacterium]